MAHSRKINKLLNKFHCSESLEFMRKMPAKSVGVIVTSPPYNLKNSTGNGMKDGRGGKWSNAKLINGYSHYDDNMPHREYVKWQRKCLRAMIRILSDDGVLFYNHKERVQGGLLQNRYELVKGLPVRQIIIWKRSGGINFNAGYFLPTYEVIYMITKPKFQLTKGANKLTDVWEFSQEWKNDHPAPFPVELARRCISASPSGIVFDPFMGSGTTAIAAKEADREWIGVDISPEYCDYALTRYNELLF